MAVNNNFRLTAYGEKNASQVLAKIPVVTTRDPRSNDQAPVGQIWINSSSNAYFVLTSFSSGGAVWTAQSTGSATQSSLEITGGSGTVLTVDAGGNTSLGGNLAVSGNSTLSGALTVNGNFVANGDFDITDASSIGLTSTHNAAGAVTLTANGGTSETILVQSLQGTGLKSIDLISTSGGVNIEASK